MEYTPEIKAQLAEIVLANLKGEDVPHYPGNNFFAITEYNFDERKTDVTVYPNYATAIKENEVDVIDRYSFPD